MNVSIDGSEGLQTLNESGAPPETRMASASDASARIQTLQYSERQGRSQRRALVKGLTDGNPPYRPADLKNAGRSGACNVNWRVSEFYLNMGRFAFYEVFSETPTYARVDTDYGDPGKREEWSNIITEEFDKLLRSDRSWDRTMQFSIFDMVLYGCGPLVFRDEFDWRNEFVQCGRLLVPDFAPSDPNIWEEAAICRDYLPAELFGFIRNEEKAREMGWNVEATKQAIMQAHTYWQKGGQYNQWEWHQQQLKNNSFWYNSTSKVVQVVHYYYREFPLPGEAQGCITHAILINPEDNQVTGSSDSTGPRSATSSYLFQKIRRFKNWSEIIHPMYYDNDGGGYHHSVTGLGVKMYSAMEYQNRLLCNVADKAFAPKILFRPLGADNDQQMNIVQYAEFGKVPAGYEVLQTPVQSFMDEGVVLNRELTSLISSNLSQYRTSLSRDGGNPITAYEAQVRASEQSRLGRTQLNHFYYQLDWLFEEKYRRAINPNLNGFMPGGSEAVKFRNRCKERGVPEIALRKFRRVQATRTVGQGSQFMRQQALQQLISISGMLPNEGGRMNLIDDYIASVAGQSMVDRYAPKQETPEAADQMAIATLQIAAAKDGVAPVVGGSQDHYIFARAFIQASAEAIQSVAKGADPAQVVAFNKTLGPALMAHVGRVQADPTRAAEAKEMARIAAQIESQTNQLASKVAAQAQKQQVVAQQQQQAQNELAANAKLKETELMLTMQLEKAKAQQEMEIAKAKSDQELAIADAESASRISLATAESAAKMSAPKKEKSS